MTDVDTTPRGSRELIEQQAKRIAKLEAVVDIVRENGRSDPLHGLTKLGKAIAALDQEEHDNDG